MWSDYELNYSMNVVAPVPGATGVAVIYGQDEDNDNSSIHIFHKILVIKKVFYNVKRNVTVRLISITLIRTAQVIKVKNSISEVLGYSENLIFEFLARFVSANLANRTFQISVVDILITFLSGQNYGYMVQGVEFSFFVHMHALWMRIELLTCKFGL